MPVGMPVSSALVVPVARVSRRRVALVLGGLVSLKTIPIAAGLGDMRTILSVALPEITLDLMARLMPQIVLSPLVWDDYDILDAAAHLHGLGFLGEYRVVCPSLPDPKLILTEVETIAPGLDFGMLQEARPNVAPPALARLS